MANKNSCKYIFVIGGVISGVGKGVTTSSIGKILQDRGLTVTAIKIDPYINVDAGTMNPTEHGEVFVLESGLECDQDMGNYERFLNVSLPPENYMTTGRVYQSVIRKERNLEYKGKCVEVVPHIPFERQWLSGGYLDHLLVEESHQSPLHLGFFCGHYRWSFRA